MDSQINSRRFGLLAVLLAVAIMMSQVAIGATIYVDDDAGGLNNGSSWINAYPDLQGALAVATYDDEIRIGQGTYKPTTGSDRTVAFDLVNGITLRGGYAGVDSGDPNTQDITQYETILSGDLNGDDGPDFANYGDNSYHVVTGSGIDETAVLDGVSISGGNANGSSTAHRGGGMYNSTASPTLTNCKFRENSGQTGGGIYNYYSSPILTNCAFISNSAGGMTNDQSSPLLVNCVFSGCTTNVSGGAIANFIGGNPELINCIFSGNSSVNFGGAMVNSIGTHPKLINCIFSGNSSDSDGGAMYSNTGTHPKLINCIFSGNSSYNDGGAMFNNTSSAQPELINCTFSENVGRVSGGVFGGDPSITNCIFWGNGDQNGTGESAQIDLDGGNINYSCVQGWSGSLGGIGNIGDEPLFVDSDGLDDIVGTEDDNLRLLPLSPCINSGDNNSVPPEIVTDLYGNPRIKDGTVDMGVYEGTCVWPMIGISDILFDFNAVFVGANPEDQILEISNNGVGSLNWGITEACDWLSVDPDNGSSTGQANNATLSVDISGLNPGAYNCNLTVSDPCALNSPKIVAVNLVVACPVIGLSAMEFEFDAIFEGTNPNNQILEITNNVLGIPLNWQIDYDCNWLSVDPDSGSSTGETNEVTLSVDISGLNPGTYNCDLTVSDPFAANSPQTVHVSLVIPAVWRNQIVFPDDPFTSETIFESDPSWVKFTIKLDDPNTVYFQDSKLYTFHYFFATTWLEPFIGMTVPEYFNVTLYEPNQLAVLGSVILPPMTGNPLSPAFDEYGIQFIRYDLYTREEIDEMFNVVKANVIADPGVTAFYFPTYEQSQVAEENQDWFESQGIPIGSIAQWIEGNIAYSPGWALGELKYFPADQIQAAYLSGDLLPEDILLTDGVPAEIPFVAGVISLSPSTPNSHVAILARTYGIPFVHLANLPDIEKAWQLLGHLTLLCVEQVNDTYNVQLKDAEHEFLPDEIASFLALKEPAALNISPTAVYGGYTSSTDSLLPSDIQYFGGKASNYGMLRQAIASNSPEAIAISFDLWNEFLDQPVVPRNSVTIGPNSFELFWADKDLVQGSNHADFKLNDEGEYIGLYDRDGVTLIDGISFGLQSDDVSYGRSIDGGASWQLFGSGTATPGGENSPGSSSGSALVINEFMAENDWFIQDNFDEYDDWFELYNASGVTIDLGGMYLTDDPDDPTDWMIPPTVTGSTLRQEIANRLSGYTYPPSDMEALSRDLSAIRSLFKNTCITSFTPAQISALETVLQSNFDANENIRFRSSTNVEDSEEFTGAGLYDSYSGCLADDLDADDDGPCICAPNKANERGVFRAIRKVFASFYNDNAFLERLRYGVNESHVGMALLAHHSFPDEIELANGVASMEKKPSQSGWEITLVTQKGATSVSNPEDDSVAEQVSVYADSGGNSLVLIRQSNLVILGETVMEWEADYNDLTQLLVAAAEEFESVTGKSEYILDFEYKKVAAGGAAIPAGGLVVKQIREIPKLDAVSTTCPSVSCSCGPNEWLFEQTHQWPNDGVSIETSFCHDGGSVFIRDVSWCRTVIRGYTTKPIYLFSSDSQFYWQMGRNMHMCYEYSFTPSLEPGADQCTLNQLRAQNIKTISMYYLGWCGGPWASLETTGFGSGPFYLGDFEPDGDVDMEDFAVFAQRWLDSDCGLCGGIDLDCDSEVGLEDLFMFAENWLKGK